MVARLSIYALLMARVCKFEFHCSNKLHFAQIQSYLQKLPIFQVMAVDLNQDVEAFGGEITITRGPNFETAVL